MSQTRQNKYPYYLNLRYENTSFKYKLGYKYQNVGTLLGCTHIHIYSAPTIKKHIKILQAVYWDLFYPFCDGIKRTVLFTTNKWQFILTWIYIRSFDSINFSFWFCCAWLRLFSIRGLETILIRHIIFIFIFVALR